MNTRSQNRRRWMVNGTSVTMAVILCVIAMIKRDHGIHGEGSLKPDSSYVVESPYNGVARVAECYVEADQKVSQGQPLVRLQDLELDARIAKLKTEITEEEGRKQVSLATFISRDASSKASDLSSIQSSIGSSRDAISSKQKELQNLLRIQESLVLRSRNDGIITSPKSMGSMVGSVKQGKDPIMTISNPSNQWYLFLDIPEDGIMHVSNAYLDHKARNEKLRVVFMLKGLRSKQYTGYVESISTTQEEIDENIPVKKTTVKVAFDKADLGLENREYDSSFESATVEAYVVCGQCTNLEYWTKGIVHMLRGVKFRM